MTLDEEGPSECQERSLLLARVLASLRFVICRNRCSLSLGQAEITNRKPQIPMTESIELSPAAAPAAAPAASRPFWPTVFEALRGSRQDYTEGPIGRAVLLLAVPM